MNKNEIYLGNKNLKRVDVKVEFTKEEIQEYIKCARDPLYFIENFVKIVHVDRGLIPFKPYDYQKDIIRLFEKERFVICKMPRQVGKTTTVVGIILHSVLFNELYSVAILANKEVQAQEILSRIQLAYEHLPKWLQQGIKEWNKTSIELENGSTIQASSTASSAIRGTSQNFVYLDEFAFVPNGIQETFFSSVYPTISSGETTKVLITSTPNGLNLFYKLWVDSENERNSYKRIDVHWSDVPGRDEKWKEETIRNTSKEQFRQEFECEFLGSSNTLIAPEVLRRLVFKEPITSNGFFKLFYEPRQMGIYIVMVDVSRGLGGDYSAFIVYDISETPYKVVATYRNNNISPLLINDIGQQVVDILHEELEYENIIYTSKTPKGSVDISQGFGGNAAKGIRTTKTTKKVGCNNFKALVENDKLELNDIDLISELYRFVSNGQSYSAEDGNDDLAMCGVLFGWTMTQTFITELTNLDIRKRLVDEKQRMLDDEISPFGIIYDGQPMEEQPVVNVDNFTKYMLS
ncbi:MAG: terminase [Proteobacteria bacterium]|nr:terminase [Pseudomonadota bacterium]